MKRKRSLRVCNKCEHYHKHAYKTEKGGIIKGMFVYTCKVEIHMNSWINKYRYTMEEPPPKCGYKMEHLVLIK